eukprot:1146919-Pelagomonas_calceolata.AAC.1
MDSALHILSGCQCPVMRNMDDFETGSGGSYGANLVQLDVGNTNRLAQQHLQVPEQESWVEPMIPIQTRRNSSRPDAIL